MNDIYKEIQALNQSALSPRAKALYLALMELTNDESNCKAILAILVYKSGTSESTVIRATKELEVAGFISVSRFTKSGPLTPPNIYTLLHRTTMSRQIDSTSAVKSTSKNNKIRGDSYTNNACHHDTRGKAPSVMDDRLVRYNKMLEILQSHVNFVDEESEFHAYDVVDLIGLEGLENELKKRRCIDIQKDQYLPPLRKDLENLLWEIRSSSQSSKGEA